MLVFLSLAGTSKSGNHWFPLNPDPDLVQLSGQVLQVFGNFVSTLHSRRSCLRSQMFGDNVNATLPHGQITPLTQRLGALLRNRHIDSISRFLCLLHLLRWPRLIWRFVKRHRKQRNNPCQIQMENVLKLYLVCTQFYIMKLWIMTPDQNNCDIMVTTEDMEARKHTR